MAKLWHTFRDAPDEIVEGVAWRIYNTKQNNKKIVEDFCKLGSAEMLDLDDAKVVSVDTSKATTHKVVKVYVKYEGRNSK